MLRAVFNWVSKVIRVCFGFALFRSVIGWQNSRHLLSQWEAKRKPIATCTRVFPPFGAGCVQLLQILIGLLNCLRLLWLVRVIALGSLVLRYSVERHSIVTRLTLICFLRTFLWLVRAKLQRIKTQCLYSIAGDSVGRLRANGQKGIHGRCTDFTGRVRP